MHYQVSRNGQMYGPYTLEDLQRYLASGNVLPTDLAKSEDMPDWLPVSQILGTQPPAAAAPPTSPFGQSYSDVAGTPASPAAYQPAGYPAAAAVSPYDDPPNLHWGLYLLFAILTCGLFSKVFTVIQAAWLRKVQPDSKGLFFYIALYILWFVSLFVGLGQMFALFAHPGAFTPAAMGMSGLRIVMQLGYLILLLVTRFVMSASIEQHYNTLEPIGLKLNPVMVFFFGGVYFQSQFNRIVAMKQAARYGAPRAF